MLVDKNSYLSSEIFNLLIENHPTPLDRLELQNKFGIQKNEFVFIVENLRNKLLQNKNHSTNFNSNSINNSEINKNIEKYNSEEKENQSKNKLSDNFFDIIGIANKKIVKLAFADKIFLIKSKQKLNNSENSTENLNQLDSDYLKKLKLLGFISTVLYIETGKCNYNNFLELISGCCSATELISLKSEGYFHTYKDELDKEVYIVFGWRFKAEFGDEFKPIEVVAEVMKENAD